MIKFIDIDDHVWWFVVESIAVIEYFQTMLRIYLKNTDGRFEIEMISSEGVQKVVKDFLLAKGEITE